MKYVYLFERSSGDDAKVTMTVKGAHTKTPTLSVLGENIPRFSEPIRKDISVNDKGSNKKLAEILREGCWNSWLG